MKRWQALLLVLMCTACRDVAAPPEPFRLASLKMSFSKVALPANVSVPMFLQYEIISGGPSNWCPSWRSSDSTVAVVSGPNGAGSCVADVALTTRRPGKSTLTVSAGGESDSGVVTVLPSLQFASVSQRCGLTLAGQAYCWGGGVEQLGLDTATDDCISCWGVPRPVGGGLTFADLAATGSSACAATSAGEVSCWGHGTTPMRVAAPVALRSLTTGSSHVCGLASDSSAYCWGDNSYGQLGDGTRDGARDRPVEVVGALHFAALSAGGSHTCGVASGGVAYCWGLNSHGQLGVGDTTSSATPVRVSGSLAFVSVSGGDAHTCGLTSDGSAYCWGDSMWGQLGTGSDYAHLHDSSRVPSPVLGLMRFGLMDASSVVTCGITTGGEAYCWGAAGTPQCSYIGEWRICIPAVVATPTRLPGSTRFRVTGGQGGCWIALDGTAYCWDGLVSDAPQRVPGQPL